MVTRLSEERNASRHYDKSSSRCGAMRVLANGFSVQTNQSATPQRIFLRS